MMVANEKNILAMSLDTFRYNFLPFEGRKRRRKTAGKRRKMASIVAAIMTTIKKKIPCIASLIFENRWVLSEYNTQKRKKRQEGCKKRESENDFFLQDLLVAIFHPVHDRQKYPFHSNCRLLFNID